MDIRLLRHCVRFQISHFPAWLMLVFGMSEATLAQPSPQLSLVQVAFDLSSPLFVTHAPGDPDNLYILERGGNIRILDLTNDTLRPEAFLTLEQLSVGSGLITTGLERGAYGLAFHPDYATNGRYYVSYSDSDGHTRLRSFKRSSSDPYVTESNSHAEILQIDQVPNYINHKAGWLGFGPDGYLYMSVGDGANNAVASLNSQRKDNLLGKILRIIPDTTGAGGYGIPSTNPFVGQSGVRTEIWAYGLRNPWRCSFDRVTGDLWIGDVGRNTREEINFQPAHSVGGENYGWRLREGMIETPDPGWGGPPPKGSIHPIFDYPRNSAPISGRCTTGGYVYRGPITQLRGHYFFADSWDHRLFSLKFDGSTPDQFNGTNHSSLTNWTQIVDVSPAVHRISSFGEDAQGNLYVTNLLNGTLYRFSSGFIPVATSIAGSRVFHGNWSGSESLEWDAVDSGKAVASPSGEPSTLGLANLINCQHGITGIAIDVQGLNSLGDAQWEYRVSPTGAFDQNANPISSWQAAPAPSSVSLHESAGDHNSNRVVIQWDNGDIANRWLKIKLTIGSFSEEFYLGHLLGETTGPSNGIFTTSFDDVLAIRNAIGQTVDAGSTTDIDKDGTVSFSDIAAMRTNIGTQLTNITLP